MNDDPNKDIAGMLADIVGVDLEFLVITDADDDHRVVQFMSAHRRDASGTFDHPDLELVMDLPTNCLTAEEHYRAEKWFNERGVFNPTEEKCYDGAGKKTWCFSAWNLSAGTDPNAAMELARSMMESVYGSAPQRVIIERGNFGDA